MNRSTNLDNLSPSEKADISLVSYDDQASRLPPPGVVSTNTTYEEGASNLPLDPSSVKTSRWRLGLPHQPTIKSFILFLCLLILSQGILVSGYINSVVTTIEKRFELQSTSAGLIVSGYEIGSLIAVSFVSYFGGKSHRPKIIAWGSIVTAIGAFICALPHFMSSPYRLTSTHNFSDGNLCNNGKFADNHTAAEPAEGEVCRNKTENSLYIILIFAEILIGMGATPVLTLGTSYIDDHVTRENSSLYIGMLYATGALAPALGFLLGSVFLNIYVDNVTVDITPNDPRWVGCWWGGFLLCGSCILVLALPIFVFPRSLAKPEALEAGNEVMESTAIDEHDLQLSKREKMEKLEEQLRSLPGAVWRLVTNVTFITICFACAMEVSIVSGFLTFLSKFIELQYEKTASSANILTGVVAVPAAFIGIFGGGFLMKKFTIQPKPAAFLSLVCNFVSLLLILTLFPVGCGNPSIPGITVPFIKDSTLTNVNLSLTCNQGCGCSYDGYAPICYEHDEMPITYFSPCQAGCTQKTSIPGTSTKNYTECNCLSDSGYPDAYLTSGKCDLNCTMLPVFMLLLFIIVLISTTAQVPALMVTIRSVSEEDKPFALGLQIVFLRALGYLPAPIYYGRVIDSTCLLWQTECGSRGQCFVYDNIKYRHYYIGLCAGLKGIGFIFFLTAWFFFKPKREASDEIADHELPDDNISTISGHLDHRNVAGLRSYMAGIVHSVESLDSDYVYRHGGGSRRNSWHNDNHYRDHDHHSNQDLYGNRPRRLTAPLSMDSMLPSDQSILSFVSFESNV